MIQVLLRLAGRPWLSLFDGHERRAHQLEVPLTLGGDKARQHLVPSWPGQRGVSFQALQDQGEERVARGALNRPVDQKQTLEVKWSPASGQFSQQRRHLTTNLFAHGGRALGGQLCAFDTQALPDLPGTLGCRPMSEQVKSQRRGGSIWRRRMHEDPTAAATVAASYFQIFQQAYDLPSDGLADGETLAQVALGAESRSGLEGCLRELGDDVACDLTCSARADGDPLCWIARQTENLAVASKMLLQRRHASGEGLEDDISDDRLPANALENQARSRQLRGARSTEEGVTGEGAGHQRQIRDRNHEPTVPAAAHAADAPHFQDCNRLPQCLATHRKLRTQLMLRAENFSRQHTPGREVLLNPRGDTGGLARHGIFVDSQNYR